MVAHVRPRFVLSLLLVLAAGCDEPAVDLWPDGTSAEQTALEFVLEGGR